MITDTCLHDPPPFNGPFFMTPPFSAVSKSCDPPSVSTPPPPLPPAHFWQVPKHVQIPDTPVSHSFFGSEGIAFVKRLQSLIMFSPLGI